MAKNTHAQEVSTGTAASFTEHEQMEPVVTRPILGEVDRARIVEQYEHETEGDEEEEWQPEDGGDSTRSSKNPAIESDKTNPSLPQPALTTENPSSPPLMTDSDVDSTGSSTPETQTRQSAKPAATGRKTPPKKAAPKPETGARVTHMRGAEDDDDEFL